MFRRFAYPSFLASLFLAVATTACNQPRPPAPPAAVPRPGPADDATVFKVDVGTAPARGPADAPITLVVFSDFQCPFCRRVELTLVALEAAFPGKIRIAWKNFPLDFHEEARPAAEAALAAQAQGKFWGMHGKLMTQAASLDRATVDGYARELKLDMAAFRAALDAHTHAAAIEADVKQGQALGVTGTPVIFVNGQRVVGAQAFDTFKQLIDQELAKAAAAKG